MMYGWWGDGGHFWWYGMIFGPLVMIGFAIVAVVAILLLLRVFVLGGQSGAADDAALEILRQRFARGEITRAEYEERRRILTGS